MKKHIWVLFVLPALLIFSACGKKSVVRTEVELEGPQGLVSEISGIRVGNRFRLPPGSYIFAFSAPGFRSDYRQITVPSGGKFTYKVQLAPVRSTALVTSSPSGAQVTMKGQSMGITPLVIRDLECGEHTLELSMRGYASIPLNFTVDSERPVSVSGNLDSNQGTLRVTSSPSRARVFIDGTEVGETPYKIDRDEGKYVLRVEREGCNPEERNVRIFKRRTSTIHVKLGQKPGGVTVTSAPAGAEVFINGVKRGVTPCTVEALEPGEYTLRLSCSGYDPAEGKISVVPGATDKKHFVLASSTGSVIFNVKPVGVEVFLDGRSLGTAKPVAPGAEATIDFRVGGLAPGKHEIVMFHSLGVPQRQTMSFRVRKNKSTTLKSIAMWIANCEITYSDNTTERGFLVDSQPGYVLFSPEPGVRFRLDRKRIKALVMLKETKEIQTPVKSK